LEVQRALALIGAFGDIAGVHGSDVAASGSGIHEMVDAGRIDFESPQILELFQLDESFVVPLLGIHDGNLALANVHGHAVDPVGNLARNFGAGVGDVGIRKLGRVRVIGLAEKAEVVKFLRALEDEKVGLRGIENVLKVAADLVLLVATLRVRGDGKESEAE
jgi:hypothetical protein